MMQQQRGMLLLPVTLALAIVGALAYSMTREGAASVSAVDDQYDIEVARYLAEAGLRLAKWQNEKNSCTNPVRFTRIDFAGGSVVANNVSIGKGEIGKGELDIDVTATSTPRTPGRDGAVARIARTKLPFYDRVTLRRATLTTGNGEDTFVQFGSGKQDAAAYLEATDGKSRPLLQFALGKTFDKARVTKAELSLYQFDHKSVQVERTLAVHAVSREWNKEATWTAPWTVAGGDYEAVAAATTAIGGIARYTWQITPLVVRWAAKAQPNHGVVFMATGLNEARFNRLNSASQPPSLVIDYYARCDG